MKNFIIEELSEINFEGMLDDVDKFISQIAEPKITFIGIGKTAYVAQRLTASYISININCRYLHAADAIHGDMGNIGNENLCIFLSYSGETLEILNLAKCLKKRDCRLLCVTNQEGSSLESLCDSRILLNCSNGLPNFEKVPSVSLYAFEILFDLYLIRLCKKNNKTLLDFSYNHPGGGIGSWFNTSLIEVIRDISNIAIEFDEDIDNISKKMDELKTGMAYLLKDEQFVGCLTSGDIRRLKVKRMTKLTISDLNQTPKMLFNNSTVQDALEIIKDKDINILFVANEEKEIIGYVLSGDLIK